MKSTDEDRRIKVLIVDDSPSARVMLRRIVETDPLLQVIGMAQDAYSAAHLMRSELPDVMLLDLEMPGIDGMTFLRRIMQQHPLPVVICSSLTDEGSRRSVEAMEAGAVDVLLKPAIGDPEASMRVCDALHGAAQSQHAPRRGLKRPARPLAATPRLGPDELLPPPNPARVVPAGERIICIGASTGGTEALREVLCALPTDCPPVVVVQHMPRGFTAAFARRLDGLAAIRISEGRDGMAVGPGEAIIAPGDLHMLLTRRGSGYAVQVRGGPSISRHRPSVDVLFRSAATVAGQNAMGVLMTGMGVDGAQCLGEIRRAGGLTVAQDEASCVVFGMPGEAVRQGHAMQVLPLSRIAATIIGFGARGKIGGAA